MEDKSAGLITKHPGLSNTVTLLVIPGTVGKQNGLPEPREVTIPRKREDTPRPSDKGLL